MDYKFTMDYCEFVKKALSNVEEKEKKNWILSGEWRERKVQVKEAS